MNEPRNPENSWRRAFKESFKSRLHDLFSAGQRLGFDILPRHYYSEIPDLRILRRTTSWRKPFSMSGVLGASVSEQLAWLQAMVPPEGQSRWQDEHVHERACRENGEGGYGSVEAEALYCFILKHRPRQIFQIGSGVSTAICLRAAAAAQYQPRVICLEPYPNDFLLRAAASRKIELITEKAQDADPERARELEDTDLFFVDSSHTLGPAGEVTRIILEFLPRLRPGVYAHFHDIYLPYDYYGGILDKALFFGHETALLLSFLTLNPHFKILCSLSMLHHQNEKELVRLFPSHAFAKYQDGLTISAGHSPSSIFLRRVSE